MLLVPGEMSLVPKHITPKSAELWIGWWSSMACGPLEIELYVQNELQNGEVELHRLWSREKDVDWAELGVEKRKLFFTNELFEGLIPNTSYEIHCWPVGLKSFFPELYWTATFETLPAQLSRNAELTRRAERPFTVMLGSCYYSKEDKAQNVSKNYYSIYKNTNLRPHLKFLVGDQVYVDIQWAFINENIWELAELLESNIKTEEQVRRDVHEAYYKSWSQLGGMLMYGANYFTSDDHEFYNDFPFIPLGHLRDLSKEDSEGKEKRKWVISTTEEYFKNVQSKTPISQFSIGDDLSFFIADTRINRTRFRNNEPSRFMDDKDIEKLEEWVENLTCPGVLVLGQPMIWEPVGEAKVKKVDTGDNFFTKVGKVLGFLTGGVPGGVIGGVAAYFSTEVAAKKIINDYLIEGYADHNLQAFKQYSIIANAISRSKQDIVVLAGDIHLGRIGKFRVSHKNRTDPTNVYEIVSSPLSLLPSAESTLELDNSSVNQRWFYDDNDAIYPGRIEYLKHIPTKNGGKSQNHFMTLAFSKGSTFNTVDVKVRAWIITLEEPQLAWTYKFTLNEGKLPQNGTRPTRTVKSIVKNGKGEILAFINEGEPWSPRYRHEIERDINEKLVIYTNNKNGTKITFDFDSKSFTNIDELPVDTIPLIKFPSGIELASGQNKKGAYDIYELAWTLLQNKKDKNKEDVMRPNEIMKPVVWLEPMLNVMIS